MMCRQWQWTKWLGWFLAGLLAMSLTPVVASELMPSVLAQTSPPQTPPKTSPQPSPSRATSGLRVEDLVVIIYQKLPFLPLENQYQRQDTGQVDPEHTLVSRLIRYHQDIKKRATRYRLDWRLTLADYLGENEVITAERYPGSLTLQTNPMDSDVKAIRALNRRQRQELVDLLAALYKPRSDSAPVQGKEPQVKPLPAVVDPKKPGLSQPGDAQFLKF